MLSFRGELSNVLVEMPRSSRGTVARESGVGDLIKGMGRGRMGRGGGGNRWGGGGEGGGGGGGGEVGGSVWGGGVERGGGGEW